MVKDWTKSDPAWKLAGGRRDGHESKESCAIREVEEETGITLRPGQLQFLKKKNRGNHDVYFFGVYLTVVPKVKDRGNEGEEIRTLSLEEIKNKPDTIFQNHLRVFKVRMFIGLPLTAEACLA